MTYLILDVYEWEEMPEEIKQEVQGIQNWQEYFAYWVADRVMMEAHTDKISKASDVKGIATKAVENIIESGNAEYPHVVLQAFQALGLDKHVSMLRGNIHLFIDNNRSQIVDDSTGDIRDLQNNVDKLPWLIYSHCLSGNFSEAEVLIWTQEKQKINTDFGFTILAYFLLKKSKLQSLLSMNLSEKQQDVVLKIFKNDPLLTKHFIAPQLENKDISKVLLHNFKKLSQNLDFDPHKEIAESYHSLQDACEREEHHISQEFSHRISIPNLVGEDPELQAEASPQYDFDTIHEMSEENLSL